jgi:hypothetical protein
MPAGPILLLVLIVALFAGGFLLPLLWYLAIALAVIWVAWWLISYATRRREVR